MNLRHALYITAALLVSLVVYLFYREPATVAARCITALLSDGWYRSARGWMQRSVPLSPYTIYSLPEGLWIFSITLTSKDIFLRIGRLRIEGLFVPLIFATSLELTQLLCLTPGRADIMDILFSTAFWMLGAWFVSGPRSRQDLLAPFNARSAACLASYAVVWMAHVVR